MGRDKRCLPQTATVASQCRDLHPNLSLSEPALAWHKIGQIDMKRCVFLGLLSACLLIAPARGASFLADYKSNGMPFRAGFIPDANRITVGEPLFITFVVTNCSDESIQFPVTVQRDYLFRDDSFVVTATNKAGVAVAEPDGIHATATPDVASVVIPPHQEFRQRLLLNQWCVFSGAGDYQVTCRRSVGEASGRMIEAPVVGRFTLTVRPADPKAMGAAIEHWAGVVRGKPARGGAVVPTDTDLYEAALALAETRDARAIPSLGRLMACGWEASKRAALQGLSRMATNPAAADAMVAGLKDSEPAVVESTLGELRRLNLMDRAVEVLGRELTSAPTETRVAAATGMGLIGTPRAFDFLYGRLSDADASVRQSAARAIARVDDERVPGTLKELLGGRECELRVIAVEELIRRGQPFEAGWVKPIIQQTEWTNACFQAAIRLLTAHAGERAAASLAECLDFNNPSVHDGYNFAIFDTLEKAYGGRFRGWHHSADASGTEKDVAENRQQLADIKSWLDAQKKE